MSGKVDISAILDECLQRLATGETVERCLARYPDRARELEPMLRAAQRLQILPELRLSYSQRIQGRIALRQALARRVPQGLGLWRGWLRPIPVALAVALIVFISAAVTTVAYSRPAEPAYPLRVSIERLGAMVQFSPARGTNWELNFATRRLQDATEHVARTGDIPEIVLDAMLHSEETAARHAEALKPEERDILAERVAAHAQQLEILAEAMAAHERAAEIRSVSARVRSIADRLAASPRTKTPVAGALPTSTSHSAPVGRATGPQPLQGALAHTPTPEPAAQIATPATLPIPGEQPQPVGSPPTPASPVLPPAPSETPTDLPAVQPSPTASLTVSATPSASRTPRPSATPTSTPGATALRPRQHTLRCHHPP